MIKTEIPIQDQFLNRIRRDRNRVTVELTTGQKIEGIILGFDNFSLILRGETDTLVYKHAISSITPGVKLEFLEAKQG